MDNIHIGPDSYPALIAVCWNQLRRQLNRRFKKSGFDLTFEQWIVMMHLNRRDGLTQQELANEYDRSKVAMFNLLKKLEDAGLIIRASDPVDGRCRRVFLARRAKKLLSDLIPLADNNAENGIRGISDEELSVFKSVLKKIIQNTKTTV